MSATLAHQPHCFVSSVQDLVVVLIMLAPRGRRRAVTRHRDDGCPDAMRAINGHLSTLARYEPEGQPRSRRHRSKHGRHSRSLPAGRPANHQKRDLPMHYAAPSATWTQCGPALPASAGRAAVKAGVSRLALGGLRGLHQAGHDDRVQVTQRPVHQAAHDGPVPRCAPADDGAIR